MTVTFRSLSTIDQQIAALDSLIAKRLEARRRPLDASSAPSAEDEEPDRVSRLRAGDERGRYVPLTTEEKRQIKAARRSRFMRRRA